MKIQKLIDDLEQSDEFLKWSSVNPDSYLVHAFAMEEKGEFEWQIGYFNKKNDRIITFQIDEEEIQVNPESEIFKKDDQAIKPFDREIIKIDVDEALRIADDFQKEKHPNEQPIKTFLIVQNLEVGQVYNITKLTAGFKTLNIKVDTVTGQVVFSEVISVADFKAK